MLGLAAVRKLALHDPSLVPEALKLAQKVSIALFCMGHCLLHHLSHNDEFLCLMQEIHCIHHAVRVECLNLIGQLSHVTSDSEIPLVTLEEYCSDPDPRVRAVSLHGLVSSTCSQAEF